MSRTFVIADTHFSHRGICKFLRPDGTKLRPWDHTDGEEGMDKALINNWNKVVKLDDKVYHLGDVAMNRRALPLLYHLNGRKVLVKGNHDLFKLDEYKLYFEEIYGVVGLKEMVFSHIPLHPASVKRWGVNVHGHTHAGNIADPAYICVSVEQINYTPMDFEELRELVFERKKSICQKEK